MVIHTGDIVVKCGLCHKEIKKGEKIYQSKTYFIFVCSECCILFTDEEVEIALMVFLGYGGYFGKLRSSNTSTKEVFKDVLMELKSKNKKISPEDMDDFNITLLHRALLYGITIKEYVQGLEILSK